MTTLEKYRFDVELVEHRVEEHVRAHSGDLPRNLQAASARRISPVGRHIYRAERTSGVSPDRVLFIAALTLSASDGAGTCVCVCRAAAARYGVSMNLERR